MHCVLAIAILFFSDYVYANELALKERLVDRVLNAWHLATVNLDDTIVAKPGMMDLPKCCSCEGCDGCTSNATDCCTICLMPPPPPSPPPRPLWATYPKIGSKSGFVYDLAGWGGMAATMMLYFYPFGVLRKVWNNHRTFSVTSDTPYVVSLGNCFLWIMYLKNTLSVKQALATNVFGFMLEFCRVMLFFTFHTKSYRCVLMLKCLFIAAIAVCIFWVADASGERRWCYGLACVVVNIFISASPVRAIILVLRTQAVKLKGEYEGDAPVEILKQSLSLAGVVANSFWLFYALLGGDPIIGWCSTFGLLIGVIELALLIYYRKIEGESSKAERHDGKLLRKLTTKHHAESRPSAASFRPTTTSFSQ